MSRVIWNVTKMSMLILLVVGVFRTITHAERITLSGFIGSLERAPIIDINELKFLTDWLRVDASTLIPSLENVSWGVFDFLRSFIEGFRKAIITSIDLVQMLGEFVTLIFNGVAQLMVYIGYFMKYIFFTN